VRAIIHVRTSYYFASLLVHLLLLLAAGIMLDFSSPAIVPGNEQVPVIQSYFFNEFVAKPQQTSETKKINNKEIAKQVKQKTAVAMTVTKQVSQPPSAKSSSHGEQIDALLALLHDAIQQHQHYPESALEMERQGRVTVSFTLFTDGLIRDLRIVKSSGTASLDSAALAAVNAAVPFTKINKYLENSREFTLDVVFELA